MKPPLRTNPRTGIATCLLTLCLTAAACFPMAAQEDGGFWRAVSQNARDITGDVALSPEKITINLIAFTMVKIRALENPELSAAFDADAATPHSGTLYKLDIPGARKFLHKNTLCGNEDTQWMALYLSGRTLQLAFFSGAKPPVFTLDALSNSSDLCGTFTYER